MIFIYALSKAQSFYSNGDFGMCFVNKFDKNRKKRKYKHCIILWYHLIMCPLDRFVDTGVRPATVYNSLPACDDFCRLLITFANSLDPDQDRQNVGPDLDLNCLIL